MRISLLLLLVCFIAQAEEVIEEVTTQVLTPTISDNLLPGLIEFATSGDATMTGNTNFCDPGEACTGAQGGTYSTTIDVTDEMSIAEINAGFDLAYGVTVNSHPSNASLPTCDQTNGDCQDNFNLTLTLTENDEVRQTYEHEFVLDYSGLREYDFEQTVVSNSWVELSMLLELYGQDAGYPTGLYGPQFTDPWLTTGYNAISYITEQIVTIVQDDMDDVIEEILEEVMEEPEPEIVLEEPEPEVIAEPEPEVIIEIEPEPEEEFIDAEELFSNPALAEIVGSPDTSNVNIEITIADPESGEIIDSFEVDFETETIQEIDTGGGFDDMTSLDSFDDLGGFEDVGMPDDFAGSGSETTEMSFSEVLDELPEIDMPEMEVAEVNVPEVSEPEPVEIEMAETEPEVVEVEVAESEPEVVEMTESEPEPEVEVAESESESMEVEAESETEVEVAEAEEESETEVAEAEEESESEPEAAGAEEERAEPTRVASRSESSDKKAEAKTETSKEKPEKSSRKQKTKRIAKKIATRVMGHLSRNYDAAMQGAALSVMRLSAPSYKATELHDLQEWYTPVQMDGGENHDHPASMWFSAQANQDMSELVKLQWRK